ncbi:restriction endonuclease subunit S [Glutamicibacter sp. AOP5-A2-18]|uniref:restriction endonuclease subunit S n=1 Tax=Glutamicibacter sp. AOP5-A2-18 TaxID=3457656 RepID=UPI0040338020
MTELKERPLTDLLSHIVDNRGRTCPTADTGVPLIATNCIKDDELYPVFENVRYVDSATYSSWFRGHPESGDIIFVCKGSPGRVALVPDPVSFCIAQDMVALRADPAIANNRYLYYLMSASETRRKIENMHVGTMIPHFKKGDFHKLLLSVHEDLSVQTAIAEVLGALDDKIVVNTNLSQTIDQFLAASFARITRSSPTIRLGEIASVNPDSCKPLAGGSLRYIDISSVAQGSYEFPEVSSWDDAPSRARRQVKSGDTLWSTVRPNRRSHALNLSSDQLLVGSTGLAVLRPHSIGYAYLYESTKTREFSAYLENVAEGSAYPAVRSSRFEEAPISWPESVARDSFETTADPLRKMQHSIELENRHLAVIRDMLLPQLMSGKLRVKDAEAIVESVV